jgi:hypothetical protein
MKKLLLVTSMVVGPALLFAQNSNYVPSGPSPLGPGDPSGGARPFRPVNPARALTRAGSIPRPS